MQFISDVAADLFQAKTPDAKDPPVAEDLGVEELVQRCDAIVGRLQGAGASAGPQRPGTPGAGRVTLSLGLQVSARAGRVLVRDTVPGGPAACSKKLGRGDAIIKIDGVPASPDNFDRLAAGTGQPGSIATLTILKAATIADLHGTAMPALAADERSLLEVKLKRMCRSEMSDNEKMFELLEDVKQALAASSAASARRQRDPGRAKWLRDSWLPEPTEDDVAGRIESCVSQWQHKLQNDMERDCDIAQKVYEMQQEVAEDAVRLKQAISKMCLVPKEQLNNTRSERDTVQSERDATREELKKAQRELISLQGEVQVQRAMNKKQRDQAVRIQEELAELRRGKENMGLQILEFETERAAAEEKIAELKERLAAADAAAQTALEAAKDDAEWNVSELKKRLVKAEAVAQQAVADLAASQSRSATAEELQEAEKINVELQYKLRAAETEKQRALSRLVVAQKELDMRDEADQAYTEREKAQYEAKRSRLIAVVESQQLEIAQLQKEVLARRNEIKKLQEEFRESGSAKKMLVNERKTWDEAHRELQFLIKNTKAELQNTRQDLAKAQDKTSQLQLELEETRVELAGAEAQIAGLDEVLTTRNGDVMVLNGKLEAALKHSQCLAHEMAQDGVFEALEVQKKELASHQFQLQLQSDAALETQRQLQELNRAYILTERLLVTERQTWQSANTELHNVIADLTSELNVRTAELAQVRGSTTRPATRSGAESKFETASADLVLASDVSRTRHVRVLGVPFEMATVQCA